MCFYHMRRHDGTPPHHVHPSESHSLIAQSSQHGHLVSLRMHRLERGPLLRSRNISRSAGRVRVGVRVQALLRSQDVVPGRQDILLHRTSRTRRRILLMHRGHAHGHGLYDKGVDGADSAHGRARRLGQGLVPTFARAGAVETARAAVGEVALPSRPGRDESTWQTVGRGKRKLDRSVSSAHSVVLHGQSAGLAVVVRSVL